MSDAVRSNIIVSCGFYLISSAGMSVFNKMAILALPLPITLVMIQMIFTVGSVLANWRAVHIGSMRDALRWGLSVPLLFSAMLVSSMIAMEHNTLGTVVVFRNVAPLFTLLIERMFRVPMQVSRDTVLSLFCIILGVVLYNWSTIAISTMGLLAIVLNMVFAVLERLLQRHLMAQAPVDVSKAGMMLLNNSCGLVPNLLLLFAYREPAQWHDAFGALAQQGWVMIALSCVNGLAISYAGLRVQQLVTATTFMVLTNVNKILVILFGVVVLKDLITPLSALGVLVAMGGGLWYAYERKRLAEAPIARRTSSEEKGALLAMEEGKGAKS